jgi:hypothetical protein
MNTVGRLLVLGMLCFSGGSALTQTIRTAGIDRSDLPDDPGGQQTNVWCWAASISYIFAYYNHSVSQCDVVKAFYGGKCPAVTGDPRDMTAAFNRTWKDTDGVPFTAHASITDDMWHSAHQVANSDVVDALDNDKPVFYGTTHHAMVLISVQYIPTPGQPTILRGVVWDPDPTYHSHGGDGIRVVAGSDLRAYFVAIPRISRGGTKREIPTEVGDATVVTGPPIVVVSVKHSPLCDSLTEVANNADQGFAGISGGARGTHSVVSTVSLPNGNECFILTTSNPSYTCYFPKRQYADLVTQISSCFANTVGHSVETEVTNMRIGSPDSKLLLSVSKLDDRTVVNLVLVKH